METRELIVKKNLQGRGFDVIISDYISHNGIPDFKVYDFFNNKRWFVEVKNENIKFTGNQRKFIETCVKAGVEVWVAVVYPEQKIEYFLVKEDFSRKLLEVVELPKPRIVVAKKCKKCGYDWLPRKDNPVACPYCKNRIDI